LEFTPENFGNTPIWLIEQALFYCNQFQLEDASTAATPVASLGMLVCWLKGVEDPDSAWFNPYQKQIFNTTASHSISEDAATTFLDLATSGDIPSWVGLYVNINLIRAAANHD